MPENTPHRWHESYFDSSTCHQEYVCGCCKISHPDGPHPEVVRPREVMGCKGKPAVEERKVLLTQRDRTPKTKDYPAKKQKRGQS